MLDPEQNSTFSDHYLNVPLDLSRVIFLTTANMLDTIPPPLRDRMEVIELAGYTAMDKFHIARRYLVPRALEDNGLKKANLTISDPALRRIIQAYTMEAGVRNLEREIHRVARKVATKVARRRSTKIVVTEKNLPDFLGPEPFFEEKSGRRNYVGVATGMAWTAVGGTILFIEASKSPGNRGLLLTGQLGDVMRESGMAALSYLRAHAGDFGIPDEEFGKYDVHVHVPAGAMPKDGPSAGIALFTALASLFTGRAVRRDTAMTGELTLRGQVLPIGGLKQKVLGAHRAGIRRILLPRANEKDIEEVPEEVRRDMEFHPVDDLHDVLKLALVEPLAAVKAKGRRNARASARDKSERPKAAALPAGSRSGRR